MTKKFEQISNKQNEITKDLQIKEQKLTKILTEQYNSKLCNILQETDWLTVTPSSSSKNTTYNRLLSEFVQFNTNLDIHLDKKFLPYIHTELLVKPQPNVELVGILSYNYESYSQDYCEVYGDGNLIYKGYPREIYNEYSQADLDAGMFQEDYTKKVYSGIIYYTSGGSDYYIQGRVIRIEMFDYLGTGCGGGDYDYFDAYIDPGYVGSTNYAKFHDLQPNTTDITGILYHYTYDTNPTPPPTCVQHFPVITESPKRLSWSFTGSNVDFYRIKLKSASKYKKVGDDWIWQSSGDFTIDSSVVTVTSRIFTFTGYWLFYSNDTRYLFGIRNKTPLSYEGIYRRKQLYNLPQNPYRIWTSITFMRNPDGYPNVITSASLTFPIKQEGCVKLFKTTDLVQDYYRINIKGTFYLSALSTVKTTQQVPVYNDVYTQSGLGYVASENHTLKDIFSYSTAKVPVQYKIRLTLTNPYEFSARENYEL